MRGVSFFFPLLLYIVTWGYETPHHIAGYWDGNRFHTSFSSRWKKKQRVVKGPTLFFSVKHMHTYGHALLDGVFPLYCFLKEQDLLETRFTLVTTVEPRYRDNATVIKMAQCLKDLFHFKEVLFLEKGDYVEKLVVNSHVPFKGESPTKEKAYFTFYQAYPESFIYMDKLKAFGLRDNVVFQDAHCGSNAVKDFVDFVKQEYKIDCPMVKNRILIGNRSHLRQIRNLDSLISELKNHGFDVLVVDFEQLPIRDQIVETVQAEYLLGTYGSNLTNAVFLPPTANVVVLWHRFAKYFWSRRYCIIHSAFLSVGARLIEYDKPEYDDRDLYTEEIHFSEYFCREGQRNVLKPDKENLDAMLHFPGDAMSEILNVDLFIDADDLIDVLQKGRV